MRVQTEEWHKFIPGVRMYKGKKTLFYNGEELMDSFGRPLIYNYEERQRWEVIIVLLGVEVIPEYTFFHCINVEIVIIADIVTRIELSAFQQCKKLDFVKLSRSLEYIGYSSFECCSSLTSLFIPDSCREIGPLAFLRCQKLIILVVPPHTVLGIDIISFTNLQTKLGLDLWIESINDADEYGLHRLCSSMDPSEDEIYDMICEQGGLHAMVRKNAIDINPSQYLAANPYADVDETKLVRRFILEKMGEIV